ncbi:MAG: hypothetical protein Q4G67_15015 [Actinomycetia bacterium]|nr:hypothetical protein [Actinomycetes bacterium]
MDFLYKLLVVTHMLGLAALIGGWIAMRAGGSAMSPIVWGARLQLITGILLVGVAEMGDLTELNHIKISVKLLISIGAVAAAEIAAGRARRGDAKPQLVDAAGALGVLNVLIAVLWTSAS